MSFLICKYWLGVSSFPSSSYRYRYLQTNKIAIKLNNELALSFSEIHVWNYKTFQHSCSESSNVHVQNHQGKYFLINVACRNDANIIKLPRVAIFNNFEL